MSLNGFGLQAKCLFGMISDNCFGLANSPNVFSIPVINKNRLQKIPLVYQTISK